MKPWTPDYLKELLTDPTPPCVSVYMPMVQLGNPPGSENLRKFRHLCDKAEEQLRQVFKAHDTETLMRPLRNLVADESFWNDPSAKGLAMFASATMSQIHKLPRPVPEHAEVADSFHIKHLIRANQFKGRYQVLALSQRNVSLYEGDADSIAPVPLHPDVPRTLGKAADDQITEDLRSGSDQMTASEIQKFRTVADKASGDDVELEEFFRKVDKAIWERHSRQSGLPLIVCCAERYHPIFRGVAKNQNLVEEGITMNPEAPEVSRDMIRDAAWKLIEPEYRRKIDQAIEEFGLARSRQKGSEDLAQVAEAATFSRVGLLLVDEQKHVGGKIDAQGKLEFGDLNHPEYDDVLDDIAERVMKTGGTVLVMPTEQMPTETGVAAIFRF